MALPKMISLGCLVLLLSAMVEATPPGIANHPAQASCKIKKYKMCYNLVHVCPKFCPDGCEVECASCKPICTGSGSSPSGGDSGSSPPAYVPPPSESSGDDGNNSGGKGNGGGKKGGDSPSDGAGSTPTYSPPPIHVDPTPPPAPTYSPPALPSSPPSTPTPTPTYSPPTPSASPSPITPVTPTPSPTLPTPSSSPPPYSPPPPVTPTSSPPTPTPTPSSPTPPTPPMPSSPTPDTPKPSTPPSSPYPTPSPPWTPSPPTPSSPTPDTPKPSTTPSPYPTPSPPWTPSSPTPSTPTPSSPIPDTPKPSTPPSPYPTPSPPWTPSPPTPSIPTPSSPTPDTPKLSTPPSSPYPTPSPPWTPSPPSPSTPISTPVTPTPSTPTTPPSPITPTPSTPPSSPYPTSAPPWTPSPSTPPSSGVAARKRVRCRNEGYKACFGQEFTCPADCPSSCEVDCNSCKPVCSCDYPGAVCQDPRFIGGDGITFYFHGKKDQDFCLVTDPNIHINAHFIGKRNPSMTRDFTWIQSLGILFNSHRLYIGALKTSTWNPSQDRLILSLDGIPIFLPETDNFQWRSSTTPQVIITRVGTTNNVIIEVEEKMTITANVVPITEEESRVHNYDITDDDCFAHLDIGFKFHSLSQNVDGVLGKTYRDDYVSKVNMGVAMPVMGGNREYSASNLFATDCLVSRFNKNGGYEDMSSSVERFDNMKCASGMDGEGVVCKR